MLKKLYALLLAACLVCWANVTFAGTIVVHDSAGWIPSGDVSALASETGNWPFDVHILTENASSLQALEDHAHTAVTGTNVVVIAIDPSHHKTVTRFGTGTGVKTGDYDSISQAGNAHFRSHEIRQGLEAIIQRAKASKEATTAISSSNTPVVLKQGLGTGTWICIILGFVALCGFIVWLVRRQKRDRASFEKALNDNRDETSELRSRNIREMAYEDALEDASKKKPARAQTSDDDDADDRPRRRRRTSSGPVYSAPVYSSPVMAPVAVSQPGPVIINNSSNMGSSGDLATGILIGEALAPRREEVIIDREIIRETPRHRSYDSDDSGGSSSSWDSGSSSSWSDNSSSSNDSGGSSSSWDSGSSSSFDSSSDSSSSSFDSGGSSDSSGGGDSSW